MSGLQCHPIMKCRRNLDILAIRILWGKSVHAKSVECTAAAETLLPFLSFGLVRTSEAIMDGSNRRAEAPALEPSSKLFCCPSVRRCLPLVYREELYHILRMTGPLLVCRFLNFLLFFVVTMFCGRLGNTVLAGYGMASATINITSAATGLGLTMACDTLVSQTFGSKNLLHVGVILQRGILILLLFCLPCWGVLINAQSLLLLLGQDPAVARVAQIYVEAYLPAIPAIFLYQLQVSYLQNQGVIIPQVYVSVVSNIVNVLIHYILLFWWDLGVHGSAAANCFAQVFSCISLFAYICFKKLHVKTWGGWSSESLQEWDGYMKLAIPSTLMLCFEWWIYEIGGFLAGMLGEIDLAAQHVVIMLAYINYMIPAGIQGAACVRVGNALGAGNTAGAILTSKVSFICAAVLAIIQGVVLGGTKSVIGFLFTSDETIAQLVSELMSIYCPLQFFNGLLCVGMGIVLGTGKQGIAAIANLIGYYCIGLPLSIALTFPAKLQVAGFWWGLFVAVFLLSIFFIVIIFKLNWKKLTEEAIERAGIGKSKGIEFRSSHRLSDSFFIALSNLENQNGYTSVNSQDEAEERSTSVAQQRLRETQEEEMRKVNQLSTSQLIIRRGLTALTAVLTLSVGLMVHFILPQVPSITNSTLDLQNSTLSSPTATTMSF
ncbi:solute carrier family 47 member 4 isoform X1 [Tachysurus fulvidraco]|uniref:solute carrier family 47 member 4 isoform X1 n=2 Tax=Tachysurus fulvidraco TaxID=1234273 RepID=UPI001FED9215|nr:solute carrier family 47 member 4 isoform X1 [Tachysurus fulvidraco]